jgi:hypothetical protein
MLLLLSLSGCAYTIGSGLTAGVLDEVQGKGKSEGVEGTLDRVLERQLLTELGHQLGQGLSSGATDIDPEQKKRLEQTIDELILVASRRAGHGLRTEVSPELREMVQKDIVRALSEGMRGELGDSLEATVDRVVARAVGSLRRELRDDDTRQALTDLLSESVYFAMREGNDITPAVGETLQATVTENMLMPIESSVGGITELIARQVSDTVTESTRRTERTLQSVIGALVVLLGLGVIAYFVRNAQVRRLQERSAAAERAVKGIDAALLMLDDDTRQAVETKLRDIRRIDEPLHPPSPQRSEDYVRRR